MSDWESKGPISRTSWLSFSHVLAQALPLLPKSFLHILYICLYFSLWEDVYGFKYSLKMSCLHKMIWNWNKEIKGYYTPKQNLACPVLYLKIINTCFWKITYAPYRKLSKELKLALNLTRPIGSWVIDQSNILTILIHNFKTAWPTKISMRFGIFLDNLHKLYLKKSVNNFERVHKTC